MYILPGIVIRSTLPSPLANQYSYLIQQLQRKSTQVFRDISTDDAVQLIRIRSNKHEIMVVPGKAGKYCQETFFSITKYL